MCWQDYAAQAVNMDPNNPQYRELMNQLNWGAQRYNSNPFGQDMAIVIPLRVELEICAVICGSQIHYVNVWEEICVHASKYKKIAFAGVMLALTEVGIALGSVIETNTLFYWRWRPSLSGL